jgi:hypothetical protein
MDNNQIDFKLGLDFSAVTEALAQIRSQFKGTDAEFAKIAKSIQASFSKAEAAAQLYGKESAQVVAANNALQKSFVQLGASGIDYTSNSFKQLNEQAGKLSTTIDNAGNSVKKSNMAWTNLSLVVQDLPFGFRGIQNNLPALVGSFAAATGPIYFAFSALIAIVTAFEKDIARLFNTVSKGEREQKMFNSSLDAAKQSYIDASVKVKELTEASKEAAGNKNREKKVVDDYNESIGKSIGKLNTFKEVQESLINQGDKYVNYIFLLNAANAAAGKVAEESANKMIASFKKPEEFVTNLDALSSAQFNIFGSLSTALIGFTQTLAKKGVKNQQQFLSDTQKNIDAAKSAYETFNALAKEAAKGLKFGSFMDPKKGKKSAVEKEKIQYFDLTKAVDDYYNAKLDFATNDDRAQREIFKQQQATYDDMLANNLISTVKWYDKTADIYKQIYELTRKIREQESRDAEAFANDRIRNVEAQLDTELKIHRKSILLQEQDIQKAMAAVAVMAATSFDGSAIAAFLKKFDELGYKLKALPNAARLFAEEFNNILSQSLVGGFAEIGNQLASVLSGGTFEFGGILGILADALIQIGKALILYSALVQAAKKALESGNLKGAIPLGILAIAAGTALKNSLNKKREVGKTQGDGVQKFANGGIISGPTYGLMGEYPGAKSNPEVVAPLDKLKDMIGGQGSGQFVLRGQDLVLALNRSEKSLTLRRG